MSQGNRQQRPSRPRSVSRTRNNGRNPPIAINVMPPVPKPRLRSRSASRQPSKSSKGLQRDFVADTVHAIFAPLSDSSRSGVLTVMFLLSVAAVYLHYADPTNGWIATLGKALSSTVLFKPVGDFIIANPIKIIGLALLIPSVCCPPSTISITGKKGGNINSPSPLMLYAVFSLIILWVKAYTFYDYVLYSVAVYLLIQLKTNLHRLIVLAFLVIGWALLNASVPSGKK